MAIFFESGDQRTMARSLLAQPALSVAQPKYFTPSLVNWRSRPVATSRTHRFQSRMKTASLPSGDGTEMSPAPPRPPPPPLPPVPPRPPAAGRPVAAPMSEQAKPAASQVHRRPLWSNATLAASADSSIDWKGSVRAAQDPPAAFESAAASLAWSKAGFRVFVAGETRTNS